MASPLAKPPAFALGMLGVLALCYLPAITARYGFADDFAFLLESHQTFKWVQDSWNQTARPVGGFLTEWSFRAAGTIAGLAYLRAAALLLFLLLALLIYRHLLAFVRQPVLAALAAAFVCTQPPFQVAVGWACLWLYLIASLLSYAAYHAKRWLVALLLLYLALNIYPPSTMFLWFWFGVEAVFSDARLPVLLRRFLALLAICGAATVLYYLIYKAFGYHYPRSELATDFPRKIAWFLRTVLTTASRLQWFECFARWLPLSVWLIIMAGIFLRGNLSAWQAAGRLGIAMAAVWLSFLPMLAVRGWDAPFRTQIALTPLIGALLFLALWPILARLRIPERVRYVGLCALVVAGLVKANRNLVSHIVVPQSLDYMVLRGAITDALAAHKKMVVLEGTPAPKWPWDEFHLITSVMPHEYSMLKAMAMLIVQEVRPGTRNVPGDVLRVVPHGTPVPPAADTAVIDMQRVIDMLSAQ